MVTLRALGKTEIVTPTDRLTPSQEIVFAAALYLFLERAKPVSRTTLAESLWPETPEPARQHRLRQTILQLKHLGMPLEATRETVFLPPSERESDLDVLFIHGAGNIDSLESLQFLPGYSPEFSSAFSHWLDLKRRDVAAATSRLLINDIRRARSRGDWLKVERLALKCMEADPFNEEAVLARAEASAMRGAKREAVSILDRYVADLGPGSGDIKLPANLMRKRISERVPEAAFTSRTEGIFVGRESDMHRLTALLDDASAGTGRCCLLWGDAGIGKSRLAAELGKFGELQGIQVRRVACRRGDAQRPLSVFVEAVPQLREMRGALGCSPDTMADLQRLTQFDVGSSAKHALEMDPQSIFELIRLAIFDLIDAVSDEQPLMLVIEDVHWLDAASARILGQLADWAAKKRLLLLFTSRTRENQLLEACTRAGLIEHRLRPLSHEAATEMVIQMFDLTNEERDEEFLDWCRTVGDGNPFFLHELVKQWLETKQRHAIPPSITAVIRERFSRLSAEATQLLQACSILGEHSTLPRVEAMLHQEPYMLLGALNELAKTSMLSGERKVTAATGAFRLAPKHDLISAVAVAELSTHAATFLHRRAGEVLESELGGETYDSSLLWASAHHWTNCGNGDRAYQLARNYADHLVKMGLPGDAADALVGIRKYCRTPAEELEVLESLYPALKLAHRWDALLGVIADLRNLKGTHDSHDELELLAFYAMWRASADPRNILTSVRECAKATGASNNHRVLAAGMAIKIANVCGETDQIAIIHDSVRSILELPDVSILGRLELEMVFHSVCGNVADVVSKASELARAARETNNPNVVSNYVSNCATALRLVGRASEANALLIESLQFAQQIRAYVRAKYLSLQIVRLALEGGDVTSSRQFLDKFASYEFPIEDRIARLEETYLTARVCCAEEQYSHAKNLLDPLFVSDLPIPRAFRGPVIATMLRACVALNVDSQSIAGLTATLNEIYVEDRATGWNDYEVESLVLGLLAMGQDRAAHLLLNEYLNEFRRDTSEPPKALLHFCKRPKHVARN